MLYNLERGSLTLALLGEEIAPLFGLLCNRLSIFRTNIICGLEFTVDGLYIKRILDTFFLLTFSNFSNIIMCC